MTTRIYVIAEQGAYTDFENRGLFIGNGDQLQDTFGGGDPDTVASHVAKHTGMGLTVYDVPDDNVEAFCRDYGNGVEPAQYEVTL